MSLPGKRQEGRAQELTAMGEEKISTFEVSLGCPHGNGSETPIVLSGPGSARGWRRLAGGRKPTGLVIVKTTIWISLMLLFVGSTPTALAQSKVIQEPDRTVYRKKTVIDFSDVAVEGDLAKPEGSYVLDRRRTSFRSLVKIRDNFVPELQKSVDHL
jgi:hypothetical protein